MSVDARVEREAQVRSAAAHVGPRRGLPRRTAWGEELAAGEGGCVPERVAAYVRGLGAWSCLPVSGCASRAQPREPARCIAAAGSARFRVPPLRRGG